MDPRWERIEQVFSAASKLTKRERAAFLDRECLGDAELRREVEALLADDDSDGPLREASADRVARKLQAGTMVGPYRVTGQLGEGGMGVVYKATDTRLERTVALKFVNVAFSKRFLREAKAISALNHPHVATLYDIGEDQGASYLVMEYVEGKPLGGPLPLALALDYGIQIAGALEAAHAAGIVHRDLKPANILARAKGGIKVLDFGLAKSAGAEVAAADSSEYATRSLSRTHAGTIVGTVGYMSPEQARGMPADHRADIWAVGVVLYEMIGGRKAFPGKSRAAIIAAVLEEEPVPLTGIPETLCHIICRCLCKDPGSRWQHIGDVRLLLEDQRAGLGKAGRESSGARRPLAAAMACIALAAAGYSAWNWSRGRPQAEGHVFSQVTDGPGQETNPSLSPDGKSVIYASRAAGMWDIYLLHIGGTNPVNLTKDSGSDNTEAAFAPDGERIAFRSERDGGGIFLMGATGESARRLTEFCYLPAWSPDGRQIACSTVSPHRPDVRDVMSSQVYVIDVASASRRLVSGAQDAVHPSWSPDGRRIAFWGIRDGARDIFTVSSEGGDPVAVTHDEALDWDPVWAPDGRHLYFSSDRGGSMNVWRIAMDPRTGKAAGAPEPVNVPATYAAGICFSRDGLRMAYMSCMRTSNLFQVGFDPAREATIGAPNAITQGVKETLYPSISRDGKWIAFTQEGLNEDIVVVQPDGRQPRRLTDDAARDKTPRWSPDGREIAFVSNRGGRFEIWTIHPDGSGLRQVSDGSPPGGVTYPAWSPDGRRISYNLPDEMAYIIDVRKPWKDQQPELARTHVPERSWFWVTDWSHDGGKLAGTVQRLDGGTFGVAALVPRTRALEQVSDFGEQPRWLPDDRKLLFHANGRLYLAESGSKRTREVLRVADGAIGPYFDVSWDGRMIVYSIEVLESDIWLMSVR
jgi:Tol biopolymer transport system component/serine/threonine protein kinase